MGNLMGNWYSLDCSIISQRNSPTLEKLLEHIVESGMDPNYEITKNGKLTEAHSSGGIGCYKAIVRIFREMRK